MNKELICCSECDELCTISISKKAGRYRCPNCGHTLFRNIPNMVEKLYAIHLSALILFIISCYFPFLSFENIGQSSQITFTTTIYSLYKDGDYILSATLLLTIFIIPLSRIILFLLLFAPLYYNIVPRFAPLILKTLQEINPWGMLDVFLVATLVSIVKLLKIGTIIPGTSLWAFALLIPLLTYGESIFDPYLIWKRIEDAQHKGKIKSFRNRYL